MRRIILTFGLIAGAILSVMMVASLKLMDRIGFDTAAIIGYTTMVAAFLMIFVGIRTYRDTVAGGTISFGKAFKTGMLIVLIAAVCYSVTWQVLYRSIGPEFTRRYSEHLIERERASGASEAEIAEKQREVARYQEMYRNPLIRFAITMLEPLPVGLVMSLVAAGVLRRREPGANVGLRAEGISA